MGPIKILVTSQKGGVGKSTLTANLAAYFAQFQRRQVALIDFDHQASSYHWIERVPVSGVTPVICDVVTERDPQLAVLKMKQALRAAERVSDIVFADLTWVNIFPQSLLLEFDLVLVPTSLSKVEMASTIEFVSRFAGVFNGAGERCPQLALVPSRLHRTQDYLDIFSQTNFPVKFGLTSPLPFDLDIQSLYGQDYIFNTPNPECQASHRPRRQCLGQLRLRTAQPRPSLADAAGPGAGPRPGAGCRQGGRLRKPHGHVP
jgi:hypothetical protein